MSTSSEWIDRLNTHHYSKDDRMLSYNFKNEIMPIIDKFMDDFKENTLIIGSYNLSREPWRLLPLYECRKSGFKIIQKENATDKTLTDLKIVKISMSKHLLG